MPKAIYCGEVINVVPRSYTDKRTKELVKLTEVDVLQEGERQLARLSFPEICNLKKGDVIAAMCRNSVYAFNGQAGESIRFLPDDIFNFEGALADKKKFVMPSVSKK